VLFGNNSYLTELDPTQPNPWVNPTHGHVWSKLALYSSAPFIDRLYLFIVAFINNATILGLLLHSRSSGLRRSRKSRLL